MIRRRPIVRSYYTLVTLILILTLTSPFFFPCDGYDAIECSPFDPHSRTHSRRPSLLSANETSWSASLSSLLLLTLQRDSALVAMPAPSIRWRRREGRRRTAACLQRRRRLIHRIWPPPLSLLLDSHSRTSTRVCASPPALHWALFLSLSLLSIHLYPQHPPTRADYSQPDACRSRLARASKFGALGARTH